LELRKSVPVVDVRAPKEYLQGHIPQAVSMPLFTDEERAIIGTLYKQVGRDTAVEKGLELVGPKLASFVTQAKQIAPDKRIIVHCWRGGMRSGSMAWLLSMAGFRVYLLEGGYKAFRKHFLGILEQGLPQLKVLGGPTGSGKTELLLQMQQNGHQVIDLEGLAHHKGSSFGAINQAPQPTTEQFENELFTILSDFDLTQPIWVEDESKLIGTVHLPNALYKQMQQVPVYVVNIPLEKRIDRLVADYTHCEKHLLEEALLRIKKRVGPQNVKAAQEALALNDFRTVAEIVLQYYDKAYAYGLQGREVVDWEG
jgi:tRNA 2-selenouridine synthase